MKSLLQLMALLLLGFGTVCRAEETKSAIKLPKPSPAQLAWQEMEVEMFACLDPCTWQNREYDNHSTPLAAINPEKLDADQWCRVAKSFGAGQILFVAKHTGGFCWWQTDTAKYSIRNTPYKGGKGDVLREVSAACKRHGLRLGIYVYPGDDNWGAGIGSGGRTKDPAKQAAYSTVFRQQLTEVLTRYGKISEVWFDGSCVIDVKDILAKHASDAVILQGPQATIRWCGNEAGVASYPNWYTVPRAAARTGVATDRQGSAEGDVWLPSEMDTTLLDHKWFWGRNTDRMMKSLDRLMDTYYKSVGRGGVLLLNSTPDTTGLIPQTHVKRYAEFGREIQRRFETPVIATSGQGNELELVLTAPQRVNHVMIQEDIAEGQRVRGYTVEGRVKDQWQTLATGTSVGCKRIERFDPVEVSEIRLRITKSAAEPLIRRFAAFYVEPQ
jgi:alpha-L-fucosidase